MVKYLKGQSIIVNDLEGDVNLDSDCEGYPMGIAGGKVAKEKQEESRAVLITGSFSACVRFLVHLRTEKNDGLPAGSHSSSIAAQILSCSLPSNHKESTLARVTSAQERRRRHPLLVRRRAFTFWRIW